MDSIRKKMQSMKVKTYIFGIQHSFRTNIFKAEIDEMYETAANFEETTRINNNYSDGLDAELRDLSKKVQRFESRLEETMEALQASDTSMESAENAFTDIDDDVNAQSRRIMLLEEEEFIQGEKLANTVHKLALMSKDADNIVKGCRHWENLTMNNEGEIEDTDKAVRQAKKIGTIFKIV